MRYIFLFFTLLHFLQINSQNSKISHNHPDSLLIQVYNKLRTIKTLSFDQYRELKYTSEGYLKTSNWQCYYDLNVLGNDKPFSKFQIHDGNLKLFYNGTESFDLNESEKTIEIEVNPKKESFSQLSFLYNSLITLRNVIILIVNDEKVIKSIADTIINNNSYAIITINIGKRRIQNLGEGFDIMQTPYDFTYKILIDKKTFLPFEIFQKINSEKDYIKTGFSNFNLNPTPPEESSWYYSTYTDEYKPKGQPEISSLLANGSTTPDFSLNSFEENKLVSLKDFKGKVVLLDFWIRNCGPCILSVPHLNKLNEEIDGDKFKLLSINGHDLKEDITKLVENKEIMYPVLLDGRQVAKDYGVSSYPTFYIIDKTGKIIYSQSGFDEASLNVMKKIIKGALSE